METTDIQKQTSGLPSDAKLYEREYQFWPWGKLIKFVVDWIERNATTDTNIIDYMCGTGFLLNELANRRSDLSCYGCSLTPEYTSFAQQEYSLIKVDFCDARDYHPPVNPDIIICTAGIHHLPWAYQQKFVDKVASELSPGKLFVVGEELIRPFDNEKARRFSIIEMLSAVMNYMSERDAPSDIITTATDVLKADLTRKEYKIDITMITKILSAHFDIEEQHRVWPESETGYGDYVFICRKH